MGLLIQNTDFKGNYNLSMNKFTKEDLDYIIDQHEVSYIYRLLGKELGDLFIADIGINGIPQTALYKTLYDPIYLDDSSCVCINNARVYYSYGIKAMLLGFVYYEFLITQQNRHTMSGVVVNMNNTAQNTSNENVHSLGEMRYNQSVDYLKVIQKYIVENKTDYPEYNGICVDYRWQGLF